MSGHTHSQYRSLLFREFFKQIITWTNTVHVICGSTAVLLLIALVIKMFRPDLMAEYKPEVILVALAVAIFFPYISHFEALGVKVDIREQVKDLSAWVNATPYYTLASEYEAEKDYFLAELYFLKSLNECSTFWPSLFGLASVYDEIAGESQKPDDYCKAIFYYQEVIKLDPDNIYSYNNLAADFLQAPFPVKDPNKALEYAKKALSIIQSFGSALYYKGEALNYLKDYQGASDIFSNIIDKGLMAHDKDLYWVQYELAVAKSNLGIAVTSAVLQKCYESATKNDEVDLFLNTLKEDQKRFSAIDRPTIQQFLDHPLL